MSNELATTASSGQIFSIVHGAKAVLDMHRQIEDFCRDALVEGVDVGNAPGAKKDRTTGKVARMLFKPGMEKLAMAFGFTPMFGIIERDIDYNAEIVYDWTNDLGETGQRVERGMIRMVVECRLVSRQTGEVVGSGVGAASTLEKRYENRPRDLENTVLKQAQTRAFRAAITTTLAMSGRFEENEPVDETKARVSPAATPPERNSANELALWVKGPLGWTEEQFTEFKTTCVESKRSWTKLLIALRDEKGDEVGIADAMALAEEPKAANAEEPKETSQSEPQAQVVSSPEPEAQPITGETGSERSKRAELEAAFDRLKWTVDTPEKFKLTLEVLAGRTLALLPEDTNAPAYADALEVALAIERGESEPPSIAGVTEDPFGDE